MIRARRKASDWDTTVPGTERYGRFHVGQEVVIVRHTKGCHVAVSGIITRICIPIVGWKFAVVTDGTGGNHACDFDELH